MPLTPTPTDDLSSVLRQLADRLDSLEVRLDRIEASAGPTIASTSTPFRGFSDLQEASKVPPFQGAFSTKGKGRADTPQAPSKAKPAKKERPTRKGAISYTTIPLPLAQTFPIEGKTDCHLVTVVIPDSAAQHIIGQGGKGLKQVHNISGARVNTYTLVDGPNDERHISIRGTDLQIGDALVVLGKQIARKKVCPPKLKKTGPTKGSTNPAHPNPITSLSQRLPPFSTTQCSGPSTRSHIVEIPTAEFQAKSSTPIVPSVSMGSPTPYLSPELLTPMQVDALSSSPLSMRTSHHVTALILPSAPDLDPLEVEEDGKCFWNQSFVVDNKS
ncbi:hypothetical protein BYT27DRAFT_7253944 [Phlegmacium glaucopus]|nr:hypothetical protein BYT27DRAFT_7253944 [Phlegmacium glaucopus]